MPTRAPSAASPTETPTGERVWKVLSEPGDQRLETERRRHEHGARRRARHPPPVAEPAECWSGEKRRGEDVQLRTERLDDVDMAERDTLDGAVDHHDVAHQSRERGHQPDGRSEPGSILTAAEDEGEREPRRRQAADADGPPADVV
jgi:hypothetical protein